MTRSSPFDTGTLPARIEAYLAAALPETRGRRLGLVGFGPEARDLAERARESLGMEIVAFDTAPIPADRLASAEARQAGSVEALLAECDAVSLHCPDTPDHRLTMTAGRLDRMREDAVLVNAGSRTAVDERALAQALWFGTIRGAALCTVDVDARVAADLRDCEEFALLAAPEAARPTYDRVA